MNQKNLWIAASDGDLERLRDLIENHGMSPNAPDSNTYTPMHAAASYGHLDLLEYLVSKGGDVNITDNDNDTPIYTVETIEIARWLVDHGAVIDRRNYEGLSPAECLEEDFPEISSYLRSLSSASETTNNANDTNILPPNSQLPSEHAADAASDALTANLIASVRELAMSSRDGGSAQPSEEEIRRAVERVVLRGIDVGRDLGQSAANSGAPNEPQLNNSHGDDAKRRRTED